MTETRFDERARLSTPVQTLVFTQTAGLPTWLRSLLSKVFPVQDDLTRARVKGVGREVYKYS